MIPGPKSRIVIWARIAARAPQVASAWRHCRQGFVVLSMSRESSASPATRAGGDGASLHSRPRLDAIGRAPLLALPDRSRGGLSPRTLQRVRDYIEAHIEDNIELDALAAAAGLSVFHFARAFKQSTGVTPHSYLLQRRIKRAQDLLTGTDLPVARIAFATGFADQSHLARHFRAQLGVSPSAFRWSKR
jgi:transcriptional regulator GlxA family with amidase domain